MQHKNDFLNVHPEIHTHMDAYSLDGEKLGEVERLAADPGAGAFREDETRIPLMEEEVQVSKRPVVKEEVRAHKTTRTETRDVSGEVRKEDIEVKRGRKERRK